MSRVYKDLTGERFGKLTVVSYAYTRRTRSYWNCKCDCGGKRIVSNDHLKRGEVTDCGCYRKHVSHTYKHRMSNTRLYGIWALMKGRCLNKNRKEYINYGGRNIKICQEWLDAKTFMDWAMENGYKDDLTLDRIDNNGDYCPENCRWVDKSVQMNNRRNCHYVTYKGETKTITQWSRESGIPYHVLKKRYEKLGWSFERAITEPVNQKYSNKKR